jgi:hypothetical protein
LVSNFKFGVKPTVELRQKSQFEPKLVLGFTKTTPFELKPTVGLGSNDPVLTKTGVGF